MAEGAEKWKALAEERKAELDDANSTRQQLEREIDQVNTLCVSVCVCVCARLAKREGFVFVFCIAFNRPCLVHACNV